MRFYLEGKLILLRISSTALCNSKKLENGMDMIEEHRLVESNQRN